MGFSNLSLVPEVALAQRLNPRGERLPFKFSYQFLHRKRWNKILNVIATTPYDGAERPTVEVHIG
jgi:hypothetical protein